MAKRSNRAVKTAKPRRYAIREKALAVHKMTMELAEALAEETLHVAWTWGSTPSRRWSMKEGR